MLLFKGGVRLAPYVHERGQIQEIIFISTVTNEACEDS